MNKPRVVIVASHPIQYQAPWFRALAAEPAIELSVRFLQMPDAQQQGRGFGVAFKWDVPVLEGYDWKLVEGGRGDGNLSGFMSSRVSQPMQAFREARPEVLIVTGWHTVGLLQFLGLAAITGTPTIMRGESNGLRSRGFLAKTAHRFILACADAFLPIGKASRAFYEGYGIAPERLFDTPYFIDNDRFAASAKEARGTRAAQRKFWKIPRDAVCFGYAGKLEPKKRILDLLAALKIARDTSPRPVHLLVVGTGELAVAAEQFVALHELPVTFAGFLNQTEIPASYVAMDCLVLPSNFGETWGLVVNEAMACGRPAIVSDRVGCAQDLVTPGETGDVFPFGDVQALAEKLVAFARPQTDLVAMGERARDRVMQNYSVERNVAGTLQAIDYVLARQEAKR